MFAGLSSDVTYAHSEEFVNLQIPSTLPLVEGFNIDVDPMQYGS